MIKIIKQGTRRKAECNECGCVFSYEEEDLQKLWVLNTENKMNPIFSRTECLIKCPQCGYKWTIEKSKAKSWKPEPLSEAEKDELKTLRANRLAISEGSKASQRLQELMWRDAKAEEAKNETDSD